MENDGKDRTDNHENGRDQSEEKNDSPQFDADKLGLLENLISRVTPVKPEFSPDGFGRTTPELVSLNMGDYPEISRSSATEKKISALKRIGSDLERRQSDSTPGSLPDLSGFKVKYAQVLNAAQLAAVTATEKPVLVIAGAGSGKTRVIVHRVSYLIERGADPASILLLTFTRKAAKEMLDRVQVLLHDKKISNVTGGTFHSFASFVLRKHAHRLGLPANFTIIDTADSEDIIDLIRTELKFTSKDRKFPRKSRIFDIISFARNKQSSIAQIVEHDYSGLKNYIPDLELIAQAYSRYKKASRIFDFDDLMEVLCESLRTNSPFRERLQDTYNYIMVDEFQDTNSVQYEIVKMLGEKHRRLMVVGDDSQSIYAFRGANYENILRFPEAFPECLLVKIEQNYRSNQSILNFTNAVIENAVIGYRKKLFTNHTKTLLPVVRRFYGQDDEASFIVDRIMELAEANVPLNQIAVLNRADWHNRYIQTELSKRGIPYVVVGGFKFSERMHVKDMVAYLKLTYNPSDAVSWHRVLKYIGGVGQITASRVVAELQQMDNNFSFEAFKARKFYDELFELGKMLAQASRPELDITQKLETIREYYAPLLKARDEEYLQRMEDIVVLLDLSRKYHNLDRFLADFALDPPTKRVADQSTPLIDEGEEKGKLTLTTVHSAKGLEWHTVFIPHALEGLFPSNRATNLEEMEEERRLFYVACSRAREELVITFPRHLYSYDAFFHLPSRFLIELDKDLFNYSSD